MKFLHRTLIYVRRHLDFLALDLATFALAYVVSVQLRRAMSIRIRHGELFLQFGIIGFLIYLAVILISQNLSGILTRSLPREAKAVLIQMVTTWSIYTVILFLSKEAHEFSRAIYVFTFFVCTFAVLLVRTIWKGVVKYSRMTERVSPKVLIISERSKAQETVQRLLSGSYENLYRISAVVTNRKGVPDYKDWYPYYEGLEHISEILSDHLVQDAYVELNDAEEEAQVIRELLNAGIVIHRSLGNSTFGYATEHLDVFGGKAVITIEDTQPSLVSRADRIWAEYLKRRAKKREEKREDDQ